MVGRYRRNPAPVVDAGVEENPEVVGEIGRGLNVDLGRQHRPSQSYRLEVIVERAGGGAVHRRARLREEVLDDHLLDVAVTFVAGGDRLEGGDPVRPVLADPDQDPGGERNRQVSCRLQGGQPAGRRFVRRTAVSRQVVPQRLDHHALAGRYPPQLLQLFRKKGAGVGVRQQTGFVEDEAAHRFQVIDGRPITVLVEPGLSCRVALLGTLSEGEERLVTPRLGAPSGDCEHLLRCHVWGLGVRRRFGERAISALVAAQHGEGNEDFRGVRDPGAIGLVSDGPGPGHEIAQVEIGREVDVWGGHTNKHATGCLVALWPWGGCCKTKLEERGRRSPSSVICPRGLVKPFQRPACL